MTIICIAFPLYMGYYEAAYTLGSMLHFVLTMNTMFWHFIFYAQNKSKTYDLFLFKISSSICILLSI